MLVSITRGSPSNRDRWHHTLAPDRSRCQAWGIYSSAARCDWPPEDDLIAIKRRVCVRDSCWSTVMFELHCTEFVFTFKHVDAHAGVMTSQLVQSQSGARMKLGMDFSVTQETFCVQMLNFDWFIHRFRVFHEGGRSRRVLFLWQQYLDNRWLYDGQRSLWFTTCLFCIWL